MGRAPLSLWEARMRQVDGAKLRRIRQERGMRPEALALQINRSVQTVNCYEIGRAQPPVPVLCQLAAALGVGVEDLLTPSLGKAPRDDLGDGPQRGAGGPAAARVHRRAD